jgi:hypothetical protein
MSRSEGACTDVRTPLRSRPKPLPSSAVDFGYPPCGRSSSEGTEQLLANQSLSRTLSDLVRGERSDIRPIPPIETRDLHAGPSKTPPRPTTAGAAEHPG